MKYVLVIIAIIFLLSCSKEARDEKVVPPLQNGRHCLNIVYDVAEYHSFDIRLRYSNGVDVVVVFGNSQDNMNNIVSHILLTDTNINIVGKFVKFRSADWQTNVTTSVIEISNLN